MRCAQKKPWRARSVIRWRVGRSGGWGRSTVCPSLRPLAAGNSVTRRMATAKSAWATIAKILRRCSPGSVRRGSSRPPVCSSARSRRGRRPAAVSGKEERRARADQGQAKVDLRAMWRAGGSTREHYRMMTHFRAHRAAVHVECYWKLKKERPSWSHRAQAGRHIAAKRRWSKQNGVVRPRHSSEIATAAAPPREPTCKYAPALVARRGKAARSAADDRSASVFPRPLHFGDRIRRDCLVSRTPPQSAWPNPPRGSKKAARSCGPWTTVLHSAHFRPSWSHFSIVGRLQTLTSMRSPASVCLGGAGRQCIEAVLPLASAICQHRSGPYQRRRSGCAKGRLAWRLRGPGGRGAGGGSVRRERSRRAPWRWPRPSLRPEPRSSPRQRQ